MCGALNSREPLAVSGACWVTTAGHEAGHKTRPPAASHGYWKLCQITATPTSLWPSATSLGLRAPPCTSSAGVLRNEKTLRCAGLDLVRCSAICYTWSDGYRAGE